MRFIAFCITLALLLFFGTGLGVPYQELGDLRDLSTQQENQSTTQGESLNDLSENNLAEEEFLVVFLRPLHFILEPQPPSVYNLLVLSYSTELEIHTPPPEA